MRVAIFSLREYVPIDHLTIIERGIAAKEGRLKIKGSAVGFDMIIAKEHLRDWAPVIALTVVVQVMYLPREDLLAILPEAPRAMESMRQAAFRLALQRMVARIALEYKTARAQVLKAGRDATRRCGLKLDRAVQRALMRSEQEMRIRLGRPLREGEETLIPVEQQIAFAAEGAQKLAQVRKAPPLREAPVSPSAVTSSSSEGGPLGGADPGFRRDSGEKGRAGESGGGLRSPDNGRSPPDGRRHSSSNDGTRRSASLRECGDVPHGDAVEELRSELHAFQSSVDRRFASLSLELQQLPARLAEHLHRRSGQSHDALHQSAASRRRHRSTHASKSAPPPVHERVASAGTLAPPTRAGSPHRPASRRQPAALDA